eukprot:1139963-Pelagomonas_calceolata.AAC.6
MEHHRQLARLTPSGKECVGAQLLGHVPICMKPCTCRELRQIKKEIYSNPDAKLDDKIKRLRQANYKLEYKQRHNVSLPISLALALCALAHNRKRHDSSPMTLGNGAGGGGTSGPIEKQRSQQPGGASLQYAMAQLHTFAMLFRYCPS